jgi:hypothetical protein
MSTGGCGAQCHPASSPVTYRGAPPWVTRSKWDHAGMRAISHRLCATHTPGFWLILNWMPLRSCPSRRALSSLLGAAPAAIRLFASKLSIASSLWWTVEPSSFSPAAGWRIAMASPWVTGYWPCRPARLRLEPLPHEGARRATPLTRSRARRPSLHPSLLPALLLRRSRRAPRRRLCRCRRARPRLLCWSVPPPPSRNGFFHLPLRGVAQYGGRWRHFRWAGRTA